ncbi:hypothetical protein [Robertmurraya sp. Marseille-Q9965]
MYNNDLDKKIEERLEEMSNFDAKDKADIWNVIEQELFTEDNKGALIIKPKKKKWGILVVAAAAMVLAFGSQTETGSALVDKVKEMFEAEKDVQTEIEGNKEDTNLQLNEGKEADYVIYVDEERYVMNKTETGDVITTKVPLEERYPEVSMTITQVKDKGTEEVYNELRNTVLTVYPTIILEEQVTEPVVGQMLLAKENGNEWDNEMTRVYVVDNEAGGSFIIQQKYFLEAEEGHGARFDQMLKEFHIVKE